MDTTRQIEESARELEERVRPQIDRVKRGLGDLNDRVVTFVRERPGACLIGALAFGYIVGRIAKRA